MSFIVGEIKRREDEKFIYFDLAINGLKDTKLEVKVRDGILEISGNIEQEKTEQGPHSQFKSKSVERISRKIPVPENVDVDKMEIETKKDHIIIKFPKTRGPSKSTEEREPIKASGPVI